VLASVVLGGCASITSESTQPVRVDALDEDGKEVADAQCDLINNKGMFSTDAGKHVIVRKSSKDLHISCTAESRDDKAEGTAISRVGAGMFGNIVFGGGIGAVIDHSRGTAYNYPEWMQLVFGDHLIFDRLQYKSGIALEGQSVEEFEAKMAEQREDSF